MYSLNFNQRFFFVCGFFAFRPFKFDKTICAWAELDGQDYQQCALMWIEKDVINQFQMQEFLA